MHDWAYLLSLLVPPAGVLAIFLLVFWELHSGHGWTLQYVLKRHRNLFQVSLELSFFVLVGLLIVGFTSSVALAFGLIIFGTSLLSIAITLIALIPLAVISIQNLRGKKTPARRYVEQKMNQQEITLPSLNSLDSAETVVNNQINRKKPPAKRHVRVRPRMRFGPKGHWL